MVLIVGVDNREIVAQRSVLRTNSERFKNILSNTALNRSDMRIKIPCEDPNIVALFLSWASTGEIRESITFQGKATILLRLWIFAKDWEAPKLQNHSMAVLVTLPSPLQAIDSRIINGVFERTSAGSPLRPLLVKIAAASYTRSSIHETWSSLPIEFIKDLCMLLLPYAPTMKSRSQEIDRRVRETTDSRFNTALEAAAAPSANHPQETVTFDDTDSKSLIGHRTQI